MFLCMKNLNELVRNKLLFTKGLKIQNDRLSWQLNATTIISYVTLLINYYIIVWNN